ncbi:hypothetical protein [Saccharothrix sp. Mg75]|uniref:hypothetical protein n=1 Tax=Saccharothrix sp. Mg75 TaxID=3445357 RepID=UPI003EECEF4C
MCNYTYGQNGWRSLARVNLSGGHIAWGATKVNDSFSWTSAGRWHVMCQEIGRDFGLDHRVEDADGKVVLECSYRSAPAELSESMTVGSYRIVTWTRACGGSFPEKKDEELGNPERICGAKVNVFGEAVTEVVVSVPADADCVVKAAG